MNWLFCQQISLILNPLYINMRGSLRQAAFFIQLRMVCDFGLYSDTAQK